MSGETKRKGKIARLAIAGELTICTATEIKARLTDAMSHAKEVEVDLSGVSEMDTAGLQLMLIAKRSPGKQVRFINHPRAVLRLIDLANLGGVLGDPLVISATES